MGNFPTSTSTLCTNCEIDEARPPNRCGGRLLVMLCPPAGFCAGASPPEAAEWPLQSKMKPKFGDKKAKNKQKKAKAKAKKAALKAAGGADADMEMKEETTTAPEVSERCSVVWRGRQTSRVGGGHAART